MKRIVGLAAIALGLTSSLTYADLIVKGQKLIRDYSTFVDNLKDFPDYAFFLCMYRTFEANSMSGETLIEAGKPLNAGSLAGGYSDAIVAIPKDKLESFGGKPRKDWFQGPEGFMPPDGVAIAALNLRRTSERVPTSDPTERIVTHLRFAVNSEPVAGGDAAVRLVIHVAGEERLDADGQPAAIPSSVSPDRDPTGAPAWIWAGLPSIALVAIGFLALVKRSRARS